MAEQKEITLEQSGELLGRLYKLFDQTALTRETYDYFKTGVALLAMKAFPEAVKEAEQQLENKPKVPTKKTTKRAPRKKAVKK